MSEYHDIEHDLEAYKYHSDRGKKGDIASFFNQGIQHIPDISDNYCMITVPMHWSRYTIRGFDHMHEIVKSLQKKYHLPYQKLLKAKYSRRQSQLDKKNRIKNRSHIYSLRSDKPLPENILIIDDVISTGSTLNACAEVLKKHGAKRVIALVLASNQKL